ncbi:MAG: CopG family transcriptional regulator [Caldilineaceae bacterium]|nr:CopG family transcriptional regulator [Caldilineaceae bacterium]
MHGNQDVTFTLPSDVLRKAKLIAAKRGLSLSEQMIELLTELVEKDKDYVHARDSYFTLLARHTDLGTEGVIRWTRESLHDR